MIQYHKSAFGWSLLFRINGSAIYRSFIPGVLSAAMVMILRLIVQGDDTKASIIDDSIVHPYAVGALVASLTFLLVFRAQQGYARYWEACGAVHHCLSKWLDAVTHVGAYHLQCEHYNPIKPPSFFDYPDLDGCFLTRNRETSRASSAEQLQANSHDTLNSKNSESERLHERARHKSIQQVDKRYLKSVTKIPISAQRRSFSNLSASYAHDGEPIPLEGEPRLDGNWGSRRFDNHTANSSNKNNNHRSASTYFDPRNPDQRDPQGFAGCSGGNTTPLFLQELAHLASLATAVALSTLRNDVEGAESPLDIYSPGSPWPPVDPDRDDGGKKKDAAIEYTWKQRLKYFVGAGRTAHERTLYNAARPLPVLGGVSESEIRFLQTARGPSAKTQLCWFWLSEFIIREHLAGSMGKVGPPIVSRCFQFLSDGMIHYNHARKIMFIPFPFPHAQLSAYYVIVSIFAVAVLMDSFAENGYVACVLAFLTCSCLSGIHEVARELENPFRNVPNEIPLVTIQAQFNEALITMFAGYHPDHFWAEEAKMFRRPLMRQKADEKDGGTSPGKDVSSAPSPPDSSANGNANAVAAEQPTSSSEYKKLPPAEATTSPLHADAAVQALRQQMTQQKLQFDRQMGEMARQQKLENERQQMEIDRLLLQLNNSKTQEEKKAE